MKNFIKIAGIVAFIAVIGFAFASCGDGSSGSPSGGGGGGGLDTRFFGTWVNDADPGRSITIEDDDGIFYSFTFEIESPEFYLNYYARKNGNIFSPGDEWSINAVFEGAKLRVTESQGYAEGFDGLYTKQ